jgi:hypothetical protein
MNNILNKLTEKNNGTIDFSLTKNSGTEYTYPYVCDTPVLTGLDDFGRKHILIQFVISIDDVQTRTAIMMFQRYTDSTLWCITGSKYIFGYSGSSISNNLDSIKRFEKLLDGETLNSILSYEETEKSDTTFYAETDVINGTGKYKVKLLNNNI